MLTQWPLEVKRLVVTLFCNIREVCDGMWCPLTQSESALKNVSLEWKCCCGERDLCRVLEVRKVDAPKNVPFKHWSGGSKLPSCQVSAKSNGKTPNHWSLPCPFLAHFRFYRKYMLMNYTSLYSTHQELSFDAHIVPIKCRTKKLFIAPSRGGAKC